MKQLLRQAAGSPFLRHNAVYFGGSLLVAFLNYLYYPVLGRLLTPAGYGEVQAIISFFLQAGVFFQVLGIVTVGVFKKYAGQDERRTIIVELEWLALLVSVGVFALTVMLSPWLKAFLRFSSVWPFLFFAFAILLATPLAFSNAYLQGLKRFGALSWSNMVAAFSKLLISAALVIAGLGPGGAILGLALSQVVNVTYTHWLAAGLGRPPLRLLPRLPDLRRVRPEILYAGLVFTTSLAINFTLSIDVLAVKHYFPPTIAGLYAGISTIARILFFLTAPLAAVLVASVKLGETPHNRALLRRSLALLTLLGATTLIFFALLPDFVITLLLGRRYLVFANQLPALSLAVFILSLDNLLASYHVALRRPRIMLASATGLLAMGVLLAFQHATIAAVVRSLIEGSVALFILILAFTSGNWLTKNR